MTAQLNFFVDLHYCTVAGTVGVGLGCKTANQRTSLVGQGRERTRLLRNIPIKEGKATVLFLDL